MDGNCRKENKVLYHMSLPVWARSLAAADRKKSTIDSHGNLYADRLKEASSYKFRASGSKQRRVCLPRIFVIFY